MCALLLACIHSHPIPPHPIPFHPIHIPLATCRHHRTLPRPSASRTLFTFPPCLLPLPSTHFPHFHARSHLISLFLPRSVLSMITNGLLSSLTLRLSRKRSPSLYLYNSSFFFLLSISHLSLLSLYLLTSRPLLLLVPIDSLRRTHHTCYPAHACPPCTLADIPSAHPSSTERGKKIRVQLIPGQLIPRKPHPCSLSVLHVSGKVR